jgi:hypothetical protein
LAIRDSCKQAFLISGLGDSLNLLRRLEYAQ